jgi:hypothetical protein
LVRIIGRIFIHTLARAGAGSSKAVAQHGWTGSVLSFPAKVLFHGTLSR